MSDQPPPLLPQTPAPRPAALRPTRKPRGYFSPKAVRTIAFYVISLCIVASVVVCVLAIWDFAKKDTLWRLVASFIVVSAGMALFAFVNGIFGDERDD